MSNETVKIHKLIDGELVPLEMKRQRFEQAMERIDTDVDKGASKKQILTKYSDYIIKSGDGAVDKKKPAKASSDNSAAMTPAEKQEIVKKAVSDNPNMNIGEIAKHVSAQTAMTYANARYIASKFIK